jgi:hypothetical protein
MFNYKPKVTGVATVDIDLYQKLPSKLSGSEYVPDFDYSLLIKPNSTATTQDGISFLIEDPIDFSVSSSQDPTEITIYEISSGNPTYYLLKKTRKAISSNINSTTFSFGSPEKFTTVEINTNNFVGILDIIDSEGNIWYEVDHLGQEMIYDSIKNTNINDPNLSQNNSDTSYILKLKKVQRRFTTRFKNSTTIQIQFGAGTTSDVDENIIPNPDNVGLGLPFEKSKLTTAYSPSNFLFTNTYGIAPSNTTLTVRYLTGGGVISNVPSNTLTSLNGNIVFLNNNLVSITADDIFNSLATTNPEAASGGGDGDTIEEIRQNSSANFSTQLRNVTQDDYLVRALSMSSKFGNVAKAYIEPTKLKNTFIGESKSILDLYILTYDENGKLVSTSSSLKQNLITYLSSYKMIGDAINIKDAFVINIGIDFEIIILPNFINNEVLINCINALQSYFSISNWQINQPIILRDLYVLLDRIDGVQTVKNIKINNKVGTNLGYSQYAYDIPGATRNNVIYPSLDPMIFELKSPNDIQGRGVSF